MSGHSGGADCPECGETMNTYSDYKPHDYVSGDCMHCGFEYHTITDWLSISDLNQRRLECDMPPLDIIDMRRILTERRKEKQGDQQLDDVKMEVLISEEYESCAEAHCGDCPKNLEGPRECKVPHGSFCSVKGEGDNDE